MQPSANDTRELKDKYLISLIQGGTFQGKVYNILRRFQQDEPPLPTAVNFSAQPPLASSHSSSQKPIP